MLHILKDLESLNKKTRLLFETHCALNERILWEEILENLKNNLSHISQQFHYLKGNIIKKINLNPSLFWEFNRSEINCIAEDYEKLKNTAFKILPQIEKMYFRSAISSVQEETLTVIAIHINMCKQQFDFITKNTPNNTASQSMQNMVKSIPENYNLDEAQKFESAFRDAELIQQNNFKPKHWYSFLNLSPKSTHDSSSGNLMLDK